MRLLRPGLPFILALVALALLGAAAPSWAHTGSDAPPPRRLSLRKPMLRRPRTAPRVSSR